MRILRIGCVAAIAVALLLGVGCSREKSPVVTPEAAADVTATPPLRAITAEVGTPTPEPTPTPSPTATPSPSPGTPAPTPRVVGGLQIVDETWVGVVREPGGLRIRSSPNVAPDNVVGSVPANTEFTVIGRVLNGQEAETGKGTTWLIVAPNQYMYFAPGSVERVR